MTAVVLTRDRPQLAARALRSVTETTLPVRVLVIDNNSDPRRRPALEALAAADPRIELRLADRNLGCAGGRRLAVELVNTELVLFLDDDAELIEGSLEHLVADLDAHPDAAGVTSVVVGPRGTVQHYGGWITVTDEVARFDLDGGMPFDRSSVTPTGPSGWAPGTASLLRTQVLREVALDEGMAAYYEDNDWCYRVECSRPGSFRRCREALVLHHHDITEQPVASSGFVERYETVELLAAQAHFFRAHGLLLDSDLAVQVPELRRSDGTINVAAARLLMELIFARGVDWTVMEWMNGGLRPLLDGAPDEVARRGAEITRLYSERDARETRIAQQELRTAEIMARVAWLEERELRLCEIEQDGWWNLRWRVLPLLRIAYWIRRRVDGQR